ncbi:MAG: DNA polymerase III subunit delta', partial [Synechococcaceae cyanobacterium SM2_3_1]|nr:DNA polymerase III subunit delta' [Synechococcaceae cyanobacterium SM2_3_1]
MQLPSTLLGQSLALSLLAAALTKKRLSTAYCFAGPEGVGRALTASWFARAILCTESPQPCGQCSNCHLSLQRSHPDLLWVEPTYLHQGRLLTVAEA